MEIRNGIVANTAAPPANVRMLRPPRNRAKTGNAWPIIAVPTPDVCETPDTGIRQDGPDQRGGDTLCGVADEHGDRSPAAERLPSIPEPRVAVADLAEVDLGPPRRDQIGDRDRPDQVADHDRDCDRDSLLDAHR